MNTTMINSVKFSTKITFIALAMFFFTSNALAQQGSKTRKRNGSLLIQNEVLTFGKIEPGKAYSRSVTITNTGTQPVKIYDIQGSCGAYVIDVPKKAIRPNETITIKVVYQPKAAIGVFHKSLIIESNANNGNDYIYLQGTVASNTVLATR